MCHHEPLEDLNPGTEALEQESRVLGKLPQVEVGGVPTSGLDEPEQTSETK